MSESGSFYPHIRVQSGSSVSAFAGGVVKVKELDWLKDDLCTGVCFLCPLASVAPLWHLESSVL